MSVYTVNNDPMFRWGAAFTRYWWVNDPSHSSTRQAATWNMTTGAGRSVNESKGGMREYNNHHSYFQGGISFRNLDENATHEIYSLQAWANAGNTFRFAFDQGLDGAIGNLLVNRSPGDASLLVDGSFPAGNFEVIIYNHLGQYDKIWVTSDGFNSLSITSGSQLSYNYTANNAIVKYAYYFHKAEALKPSTTLSLRPGAPLYDWSISFRELMDVSMLS